MTDLYELTGPAPSDPCGIEGTPPNLSDLHVNTEVEWELQTRGVGPLAIPVYVRTRNEINVTVTVTDNVGLSWIRFHIEDKGEQKARFTPNTNYSTVTVFFKHDLWSKWVDGYDLNITVSDVNGNEGYLEFHIDSALEAFVQWLIGQVTALAEFVMERASAAIAWIWGAINSSVNRILKPLIDSIQRYIDSINNQLKLIIEELYSTDSISSKNEQQLANIIFGPFFQNTFIIILVISYCLIIIEYFLTWLAWLLLAVLICIYSIIMIIMGVQVSESDINEENQQFGELKDYFNVPLILPQDGEGTREQPNWPDVDTYYSVASLITSLITSVVGIYCFGSPPDLIALSAVTLILGAIISIFSYNLGDPFERLVITFFSFRFFIAAGFSSALFLERAWGASRVLITWGVVNLIMAIIGGGISLLAMGYLYLDWQSGPSG
jgi:SH3-like domain-containing protein